MSDDLYVKPRGPIVGRTAVKIRVKDKPGLSSPAVQNHPLRNEMIRMNLETAMKKLRDLSKAFHEANGRYLAQRNRTDEAKEEAEEAETDAEKLAAINGVVAEEAKLPPLIEGVSAARKNVETAVEMVINIGSGESKDFDFRGFDPIIDDTGKVIDILINGGDKIDISNIINEIGIGSGVETFVTSTSLTPAIITVGNNDFSIITPPTPPGGTTNVDLTDTGGNGPKLTSGQKAWLLIGKMLYVHACIFTAASLVFRLFKAFEAQESIDDAESEATFELEDQRDGLIRVNEKDNVIVKFIKWSMNTYDPLAKYYSYLDQFKGFFKSIGLKDVNDKDEEEFVKIALGKSATEFLEQLTLKIASDELKRWSGFAQLSSAILTLTSSPESTYTAPPPKSYNNKMLFADFLRFLIESPSEDVKLTLEHRTGVITKSSLNIGFNHSVLTSDFAPRYLSHPPGIESFKYLLKNKEFNGIELETLLSGRSTIICKNNSFIAKELEKDKTNKKRHRISLLVPKSFCEEGTTKKIDETLLTPMDPETLKKHLSLMGIRDKSCEENTCGVLRVDVALHKPPPNGCTEVEYEIDFFPAPFPNGPKPSGPKNSPDSLLSVLSPPNLALHDTGIQTSYLIQRINRFEDVLPTGSRHGEINKYVEGEYSPGVINAYKQGIASGLYENLKIDSFKSETFHAGCMTRFKEKEPVTVRSFSQTFKGKSEEEVERLQEQFLFDVSGEMKSPRAEYGYLPEFISGSKEKIYEVVTTGPVELGYFHTKVPLVGGPADDSVQRIDLLTTRQKSVSETGDERFLYTEGYSPGLGVTAALVETATTVEQGDPLTFIGQGETIEAAKLDAEEKFNTSKALELGNLEEISHTSDCESIPSPGEEESYTFYVGRDQIAPSIMNKLAVSIYTTPDGLPWVRPFGGIPTSFSSIPAAQEFINGPVWKASTDQTFSEFIVQRGIKNGAAFRTLDDFDRTVTGIFEWTPELHPLGSYFYYYIRNSEFPYAKDVKIKYTLKPGLPSSTASTDTFCIYSLIAAPSHTIRKYLLKIPQSSHFEGDASIKVSLPVYEVCQKRRPHQDGNRDQGDYSYTYPAGSLRTSFESAAEGGFLNPQVNLTNESQTVSVHSHFNAFLTLFARTPGGPTKKPTFFIKGFPLINLRSPITMSQTFSVKIREGGNKKITMKGSEVEVSNLTSLDDIAKHLKAILLADNPTRTDIQQRHPTQVVSGQVIRSYSPFSPTKGEKNEITMKWTESLRYCKCNSESSDVFSGNLFYGESYYLRVKRKIVNYSFSPTCKIVTARNDGSVLFPGNERIEGVDGFVSLITFDQCSSDLKRKYIKLVIQ